MFRIDCSGRGKLPGKLLVPAGVADKLQLQTVEVNGSGPRFARHQTDDKFAESSQRSHLREVVFNPEKLPLLIHFDKHEIA